MFLFIRKITCTYEEKNHENIIIHGYWGEQSHGSLKTIDDDVVVLFD